mmetsp:Transcript_17912/g.50137  ORF Transcript_17912/g.50137 Transcript_17912/m.50137 type:complete len:334 (+) Transcript_17912:129-1130(+)
MIDISIPSFLLSQRFSTRMRCRTVFRLLLAVSIFATPVEGSPKLRTFCESGYQKTTKALRKLSKVKIEEGRPRSGNWWDKHSDNVRRAEDLGSRADIVLYGDSITEHIFEDETVMGMYNSQDMTAEAFGLSGDRPEQLLYRLQHGEWQSDMKPRYVVIMIGINQVRAAHQDDDNAVEQLDLDESRDVAIGIIRQIRQMVAFIHEHSCQTEILLHSLLPIAQYWDDAGEWPNAYTPTVTELNKKIRKLGKGLPFVHHVDCSYLFVSGADEIPAGRMPDYLHPSSEGRRLMAACVMNKIRALSISNRNTASGFSSQKEGLDKTSSEEDDSSSEER